MKPWLNCQEVTRKLLAQREQPLAWHDHLVLRLHWAVCDGCRHFRRQAQTMDRAMVAWRKYREGDEPSEGA